jgi:hypothetical protein
MSTRRLPTQTAVIKALSKLLFWTVFWLAWLAAFYGAIVLAIPAHADADGDFLGCLSNHAISVHDRRAVLDDFHMLNQFVNAEAMELYLTMHGMGQSAAKEVALCSVAATLMGGH